MAEGWANHLCGEKIVGFSAGVSPGRVNERAISVMKEAGVDISGHRSKHVDDLVGLDFDLVVTVCDNAKQQCPLFPGKAKVVHNKFDDPSEVIASDDVVMSEFRRVRDEIRDFVKELEV